MIVSLVAKLLTSEISVDRKVPQGSEWDTDRILVKVTGIKVTKFWLISGSITHYLSSDSSVYPSDPQFPYP